MWYSIFVFLFLQWNNRRKGIDHWFYGYYSNNAGFNVGCDSLLYKEHYREYRCLVHDEKYMINFIEESLKSGDLEEIQQLLCRCKEKFVRKDYWTGISIVDRVITMEKRKMDELDIDFCLNAEVMDIIVKNVNHTLIFKLRNSNSKLPNRKGKKFLTDKMDTAGHGWGIESVKHIVEKYNGSVHFNYDESFFDVLIIIER